MSEPALMLQRRLCRYTRLKLDVEINDNRSTMLRVLERQRGMSRVSIHRMFIDAPDHVLEAVAQYIQGHLHDAHGAYNRVLRTYIQQELARCDYSHRVDHKRLVTQGTCYDLQAIYDALNARYFNHQLNLRVTWYGVSPRQRGARSRARTPLRLTFGLYYDSLKLIKIHRLLDDPFFPPYFLSYVVYHEMLHEVIPGEVDARGLFRVHTKAFQAAERQFIDYVRATHWEVQHKEQIFCHGRT